MTRRSLPAVFMRGGTSKALMFHARDLPARREDWAPLFLAAMGSPDPHGRQLDGMGGGVSSLSKVCVIGPPSRADADIDYTFAQVLVKEAHVDYRGNCGNMLAAVGPYAIDEGLVRVSGGQALVRIHNTNTRKIVHARFPLRDGRAREDGDLVIPGVAGSGAPIRLDFLEPGGATTGKLLPSGRVAQQLAFADVQAQVSMVDAGNACVFIAAADVSMGGSELPEAIERNGALMQRLLSLRAAASVAMGIAPDEAAARRIAAVPYVAVVSPPCDMLSLAGDNLPAADMDLNVRVIASGQPHRALPLTVALCAAVAARIEGSVVQRQARTATDAKLRLGMPSGVLTLSSDVVQEQGVWQARSGSFYRTARRLFEGRVMA